MRILELQDYAKKKGVTKFTFTNLLGDVKSGEWIDPYFGLFKLDDQQEGMIHVNQWRDIAGDTIEFEPIEQ